ncbi:NAD-dependent epimerase/dehydratase family protein [Alloscardovia criceti]|uniref:NAD-dependent epimerase/dehydratase family protein n=1 Tax=Alloscardovia criceti TaxID=356828 RepID=UPI00035C1DF3|nr:NAD-dependent epimerase/dehydratase family protein [Alloscardovia criceti]
MKILMIGGTGTISTAISGKLIAEGNELYVLNRTGYSDVLGDAPVYITADMNGEISAIEEALEDTAPGVIFDAVCEFIGYEKSQVERDFEIFHKRTHQYVYISSASAYEKPVKSPIINEETPLLNPYWQYSRNKIECEKYLMDRYREDGFPVTIVRPSHTYCERSVPLGLNGHQGSYQVLDRMLKGKPVLIQGDGTTLWTMTDSRDFAIGYVGLLGNPEAIGEVFQITSDESLTWNQIFQAVADALGVELKPYHVSSEHLAELGKPYGYDFEGELLGDKAYTVIFDNAKIKKFVPAFHAQIRFADGVKRTVEYVLSHPECQKLDPEFDQWCDQVIAAFESAKQGVLKRK